MTEADVSKEVWEEIFNALYNYIDSGKKSTSPFKKVSFWEYHQIDVLNRGACGTYSDDNGNPLFDFEIRDGNNNGSEVIRVCEPEELSTPKRYYTEYFFAPDDSKIDAEHMERAWYILHNNSMMMEMEGKMKYDLHFCPSIVTRKHYEDYAKSISAVISSRQVEVQS